MQHVINYPQGRRVLSVEWRCLTYSPLSSSLHIIGQIPASGYCVDYHRCITFVVHPSVNFVLVQFRSCFTRCGEVPITLHKVVGGPQDFGTSIITTLGLDNDSSEASKSSKNLNKRCC